MRPQGNIVVQVVSHLPPTCEFPSLRLGHSMRVSCWTKDGLDRLFSEVLSFFPTHFPHSCHSLRFKSFHRLLWWCGRRGRSKTLILTDLQYSFFIASHTSNRPFVGHELWRWYFTSLDLRKGMLRLYSLVRVMSLPLSPNLHGGQHKRGPVSYWT